MATVDIDLTNQGVGLIDQSDYDGDTVLNVLSDGYSVLDVRNENGPTGDVLEVQYTYVTQDVDHDFCIYTKIHMSSCCLPSIRLKIFLMVSKWPIMQHWKFPMNFSPACPLDKSTLLKALVTQSLMRPAWT